MGVLDLSIVTDLLIQNSQHLLECVSAVGLLPDESFFTPSISGQTPETVRTLGGCQVTVSLFHIETNKSNRIRPHPAGAAAPF